MPEGESGKGTRLVRLVTAICSEASEHEIEKEQTEREKKGLTEQENQNDVTHRVKKLTFTLNG